MNMTGDPRNLVDGYKGMSVDDISADMSRRAGAFHVAIENLQHDFNIGSIVRSANAFNVAGVHIIGRRHWNRRGAMATEKYLPLYQHPSVEDFVKWTREHNLGVIGIDNVQGAQNLSDSELPPNVVLVFGQEGPGISPELREACQYLVAIEQFGSTRSVNVGVAAGIVMYEWIRRNQLQK